ncbi:IPT/TIG domain-containing protein [Gynurincola endophyticus]|uniref:IPT/TIG domain-containing protein n=1 Tax=Gynurincola endophyticus TaxID=2479004 RepID=UPI0013158EA7|nr:IPT/TIG domain-containing protein [Gynurincola endophyticus]
MNFSYKKLSWLSTLLVVIAMFTTIGCGKKDKAPEVVLRIDSYYPNSGNAGTLVTIEGSGFVKDIASYKTTIGGVEAEVIGVTANTLVLRAPFDGKTGNLTLAYNNKNYEVGTYTYQSLSVSSIFPTNGSAGTQIRINGTGFSSTEKPAEVLVNEKSAIIVSVSDTLIVAEVPDKAGTGAVKVKVNSLEASGQNFKYQAIDNIKPKTGGANTKVVITGGGFEETTTGNTVDFNGKIAVVLTATESTLEVLAPEEVTTGPLSVVINGQKLTGETFTVVDPPTINFISPQSGPQGAEMTISGTLFSTEADENKVFINGIAVPVTSASATQLKLTIPGGTGDGIVKVIVNDQAVEGPVFKDQTLGIAAISPDNGLAGTSVTIAGTGFNSNPTGNTVYFGDLIATITAADENSLTVTAPQNLVTGKVKVVVGQQEAESPQPFKRAGIMTLAGGPASDVFASGAGGIALDRDGNVYITDRNNNRVKKITQEGVVTTLKENGVDIEFSTPWGIAIDKNDNIYVAESGASRIRKISSSGQVTVHASGFSPAKMTINDAGELYVNVSGIGAGMNKVYTVGNYTKVAGPGWVWSKPYVDPAGNIYYSDQNTNGSNGIDMATPAGIRPVTLVGQYDGGYKDGFGTDTYFNGIESVIYYAPNTIMVGEASGRNLRLVNISSKQVSTLIRFSFGYEDGTLQNAKVSNIYDVAIGKDGSIYILDANNKAVRKMFLQ